MVPTGRRARSRIRCKSGERLLGDEKDVQRRAVETVLVRPRAKKKEKKKKKRKRKEEAVDRQRVVTPCRSTEIH